MPYVDTYELSRETELRTAEMLKPAVDEILTGLMSLKDIELQTDILICYLITLERLAGVDA